VVFARAAEVRVGRSPPAAALFHHSHADVGVELRRLIYEFCEGGSTWSMTSFFMAFSDETSFSPGYVRSAFS
jgi:hypothetical protein